VSDPIQVVPLLPLLSVRCCNYISVSQLTGEEDPTRTPDLLGLNEATHVNNKQTLKRKFCANNVARWRVGGGKKTEGYGEFRLGRVRKIRIRYTGYGYVRREAGTGTKVEGPSLLSPQKFRCCNKLLGISCEKCGNAAAPRSSLILRHKNGSVQPASGYRTRPRAGDSSTAVSGTTALCICLFGYREKSDHISH